LLPRRIITYIGERSFTKEGRRRVRSFVCDNDDGGDDEHQIVTFELDGRHRELRPTNSNGTRVVPPADKPSKMNGGGGSIGKKRSRVDGPSNGSVVVKDASRQGETRPADSQSVHSGAIDPSSLNALSATGNPSNYFDNEWKQQRAKDVMAQVFGVSELRGLQPAAVQCAFEGKSQIVVMATGAGKSLCYQLPALVLGGTTIVVSPLIALMEDQVQALLSMGVTAAVLASSKSDTHNRSVLERLVGRPLFQSQAKPTLQQTKISKSAAQEGWTSGEYQVVVATSAFGAFAV
jgi:DEAD/DEAH box helicase